MEAGYPSLYNQTTLKMDGQANMMASSQNVADDESDNHVVVQVQGEDDSTATNKEPWTPWISTDAPSRIDRDDTLHERMLHKAIEDTGRWAFGTVGVEVWVMDDSISSLVRPEMGWWVDPALAMSSHDTNEALMRLVDDKREDYVPAEPLAPGCGLPGALWTELSKPDSRKRRKVVWRQVRHLAMDPDQPYNPRLKLMAESGFGLAAGVKFQFHSARGIVVYFARETANMAKLQSQTNEDYLRSAADVIGSVVAIDKPRKASMAERRKEREDLRRRVRLKLIALVRIGGRHFLEGLSEPQKQSHEADEIDMSADYWKSRGGIVLAATKEKILRLARKCKGVNVEPPPPMPGLQALWSFLGVFTSLLAITQFSAAITRRNPNYGLVMGPFGALMTLQYGLTAAPASQPRNALFGQLIAISIALGMTYTNLELHMRQSLGTAIAIMFMTRLGITHPPAGAAALIFAGGNYTWGHMGLMLVGNLIAICTATLINNMADFRQYPTFWGVGYWWTHRKLMIGKSA